jgi:hypothetical protein
VRYSIPKRPHAEIQQDLENDVFFWDGEVCVRSSVVTIGNPPSNVISIANLQGASIDREKLKTVDLITNSLFLFILLAAVFVLGWVHPWLAVAPLLLSAVPVYLMIRPRPWVITLKKGGVLADEYFCSKDKKWSHDFVRSVTQAIMGNRGGSGGQSVHAYPIFPDPVLSKN